MSTIVDKLVHITEERAQRLSSLASASGMTEDALIEKAIDILFDLSRHENRAERQDWNVVSAASLQRVWDNDADAVYDNWRELYGVPQG